ncbi:hypothetical protein [Cohnella hongkongensis]|uniref:Uncharacterized protein n=1 Tax=Cohnella hongkongensis TaxID=178337 RepID=A0ABV9FIQ5_9BACL
MRASADILDIWRRFDPFPMETLTKAWYLQQTAGAKQRTVEQMKLHREQYGTAGNCFDLAIWLNHEFNQEKLSSYAILTPDAHVAVVVLNEHGHRYLCDLGDQWIEPILIDPESEDYTEELLEGFFPGSLVKVESRGNLLLVTYRRPNGKESKQTYTLDPISNEKLIAEGEKTQRTLWHPLVEKRIFTDEEVIHWEFDNFISFYSTMAGKQPESRLETAEEWAERIGSVSGISKEVIRDALEVYMMRKKAVKK